MTGERWTLGRRRALDGVRGVAILLVLVAHMAVPGLTGAGALGVTLFFTLSGFLITALLLEEHNRSGRVDLPRFYRRRAQRLLPALLASTAVVVAVGLAPVTALTPVLLYYANWMTPTDLGALTGTWSLAVEEQFYLIWPAILLLCLRGGRRVVLAAAAVGAVASIVVRAALIAAQDPDIHHIYTGTDSVAFALLAGAALAAWQVGHQSRPAKPVALMVGAVLLLAPVQWSYGLALAVGPLIAAAGGLLLVAHSASAAPARLLEAPALTWLGRRSYGLYLWHVPLGYLLRDVLVWSWPAIVAVMLPASLLLAEASYRWVEAPFRRPRPARHASGVMPATTVHDPSSSLTFSG